MTATQRSVMLFDNASRHITQYNRYCLHYNLAADAVYQELRRTRAPFSPGYEPYLVAALVSFDMGRTMGDGVISRYDLAAGGFASKLHEKLRQIEASLAAIIHSDVFVCDISKFSDVIVKAYERVAARGQDGLDNQGRYFHVGATKLLHLLNPDLFLIVDRNTARTLRETAGIAYTNTTQPGYSGERYFQSLSAVKEMIAQYGVDRFRSLEPGTPIMRVFDKIAFAHGALNL